jgi:hypothetical protein
VFDVGEAGDPLEVAVEEVAVRPLEANLALGQDEPVVAEPCAVDVVVGIENRDRDSVLDGSMRGEPLPARTLQGEREVVGVAEGVFEASQGDRPVDELEGAVLVV